MPVKLKNDKEENISDIFQKSALDVALMRNDSNAKLNNMKNSSVVDPDANRLEDNLDKWTTDFLDAKSDLLTKQNEILQKEKTTYLKQLADYERTIEHLKEELVKSQADIEKKIALIDNFSTISKVDPNVMGDLFAFWKSKSKEKRYEELLNLWAYKHYIEKLCRKVIHGWTGFAGVSKLKSHEKFLRREFASIEQPLRQEIIRLRGELDKANKKAQDFEHKMREQEHSIKESFMRGVSALNIEAMHLFKVSPNAEPMVSNKINEKTPNTAFVEERPLSARARQPLRQNAVAQPQTLDFDQLQINGNHESIKRLSTKKIDSSVNDSTTFTKQNQARRMKLKISQGQELTSLSATKASSTQRYGNTVVKITRHVQQE
ncbi:hypothetical protein ROZALSC1DRAFT_28562 [Rozella allomycis CSF55]|uniref:Centrosomal protein POC5 n=1 Tax=Rozella allomycis (strain CSF55) TaxID=988480 RepID=A0A075B072_ROZAC|nr:hypothetical protein O9G_005383 [Rozella allomycis CSF55]RKP19887.1 hypothetical protein ROZALSC1DRAFT_28562 [Rozella allomycis CSF55]|eukprot:EPZ35924.1 hypothetical protein O9G_005383 [Rozella allomycis CSF55]